MSTRRPITSPDIFIQRSNVFASKKQILTKPFESLQDLYENGMASVFNIWIYKRDLLKPTSDRLRIKFSHTQQEIL